LAHNDLIHEIVSVSQTNEVWTCARDGSIRVWKLAQEGSKLSIKMIHELSVDKPVKCARLMTDGRHLCTGDFGGSVTMWNIKTFQRVEITMPEFRIKRSVLCLLDTETALWCGFETSALMYHPYKEQRLKYSRQELEVNKASYNDL